MRLVLSNLPPDRAEAIATTLVDEGLAACVNLLPATSVYRWEGRTCAEPEVTALIKVAEAGLPAMTARLLALHPYDLPEILALPVDVEHSLAAYLRWVRDATPGEPGP